MTPELATILVFLAIILIPSLIALGGVIYVSTQLVPVFKRQSQQLIDNNTELTKLTRQNTDVAKQNADGLNSIKTELVKQTGAIENQTTQITTQGIDFRAYQTLVSDELDNYRNQIETNTSAIKDLYNLMEQMPQKIILGIQDKLTCNTVLAEFQVLRGEITRAMFQQQTRSTGTFPVAVPSTSKPAEVPTLPTETAPKPSTP